MNFLRRRSEWKLRWCLAACILCACSNAGQGAEAESAARPVPAERIAELIRLLGADDYFAREKAQTELSNLGAEAFDALSEMSDRVRDVEVGERIAYLLRTIRVSWVENSDPPQVRALLQNYEGMSEQQRADTLTELAALPDVVPVAALCRIVRFEPSQPLSKQAALLLLDRVPADDAAFEKHAKAVTASIGSSPRAAADWIRKSLLEHKDPTGAATAFAEFIDAEESVLRQYPHRSRSSILIDLLRRQAKRYDSLDRPADATAALLRMVGFEQGDSVVLNEVLQLLSDRKDWAGVEQLVERYGDRIRQEPLASYSVARAYQIQGKTEAAEQFATAARALNPNDQRAHILMGINLRNRGWVEWAEAEYRLSIAMGVPTQAFTLIAAYQLGESLHDRGDDAAAAAVLDQATRGLEAAAGQKLDVSDAGRGLEANRARAHYFHALHQKSQGDKQAMLTHLLDGLEADPADAEILIELFHVADLEPAVRDRVRKLIRESADDYRKKMAAEPDDDTHFNQFAWLISNTEGDFNEALEASKRSLVIKPESPGHLDTLGRCYFALGDLGNAVKNQKRAIELDPHSQQMHRQLKLFEAELAKRKKSGE